VRAQSNTAWTRWFGVPALAHLSGVVQVSTCRVQVGATVHAQSESRMTRFLGWYLAAVLAAYSLSTSWSLGTAGARVAQVEQQAAQLAAELDDTRSRLNILDQRERCATEPESCLMGMR
jgi:hypothetical protein